MFKNIAKNILIMLEYEEAINLILNEVNELEEIKLNISDSLGYVTSRKVFAKIDLPPFDNSAVDGYAVKSEDVANASKDNPVKLKIGWKNSSWRLCRF